MILTNYYSGKERKALALEFLNRVIIKRINYRHHKMRNKIFIIIGKLLNSLLKNEKMANKNTSMTIKLK